MQTQVDQIHPTHSFLHHRLSHKRMSQPSSPHQNLSPTHPQFVGFLVISGLRFAPVNIVSMNYYPVGLGLLVAAVAVLLVSSAAGLPNFLKMSTTKEKPQEGGSEQPEDFQYYQIYVAENGTTHFTKCRMHGFDLKSYSSKPQFVRSDFGGEPSKLVFTELAPGLEQDLHSCPQVQFVVTLSGSWYVKTSDGTKHVFKAGDVLFQDNTKDSPAADQPQHYSGVVGDKPCQQMIVQLSRAPEINNPNPF